MGWLARMQMRSSPGLVAAVLVVSLAGCSSGDPLTVEFTQPQGHEGALPFSASGAAVDESAMCSNGTVEMQRLESAEGEGITDSDWAEMFDGAMESGGVAEMYVFQKYTCDDGSGDFTIRWHNRFDFASFEFEGRQDVGAWEIDEGANSYSDLTGSGEIILDWEAEQAVLSGVVQRD
jgi:hypothetical protein